MYFESIDKLGFVGKTDSESLSRIDVERDHSNEKRNPLAERMSAISRR